MYPVICSILFWWLMQDAVASSVSVAVAASVQPPFIEIAQSFQRLTGITVKASFGSSGKLVAQLMNGAPFDVFLSADIAYPDALYRHGIADAPPRVYAFGTLILWTVDPHFPLEKWQQALRFGKHTIAIANPDTAPFGREAIRALKYYRLLDNTRARLVYGESVAQTNYYIESRVADIGFTSQSTVLAPNNKIRGRWLALPTEACQPIPHGVIMLSSAKVRQHGESAQRFINFLFTPSAQAIWQKFRYSIPK